MGRLAQISTVFIVCLSGCADVQPRDSDIGVLPQGILEDSPDGQRYIPVDEQFIAHLQDALADYEARVEEEYGLIESEVPASRMASQRIVGTDDRTVENYPRSYPNSKHVFIIMQRPHTEVPRRDGCYICSGTFLDEDNILTNAHCVYNRGQQHWAYANTDPSVRPARLETAVGVDYGRGYVCLGGEINDIGDFEDYCEFISARWTTTAWTDGTDSVGESDYAIVRTQRANHTGGLGQGRWMALSSIDAEAGYENRNVIVRQYPVTGPGGTNTDSDWDYVSDSSISMPDWQAAYWEFWHADQLDARGDSLSQTTREVLHHDADTSHGTSGASIFYYVNGSYEYSGQAHYILGVHHGSNSTHNLGPTVHQFRNFAVTVMAI